MKSVTDNDYSLSRVVLFLSSCSSGGAIAGAVVGSLFFVAIVAFIICFCCWLRKRNAAGTPGTVARPTGPVIVQSTPGNVPAANPGKRLPDLYALATYTGKRLPDLYALATYPGKRLPDLNALVAYSGKRLPDVNALPTYSGKRLPDLNTLATYPGKGLPDLNALATYSGK